MHIMTVLILNLQGVGTSSLLSAFEMNLKWFKPVIIGTNSLDVLILDDYLCIDKNKPTLQKYRTGIPAFISSVVSVVSNSWASP